MTRQTPAKRFDAEAEVFYRRAVRRSILAVEALEHELAANPTDELWLDARIAVAELMMWAVGYAHDVRGQPKLYRKDSAAVLGAGVDPADLTHFLTGAFWARNASSHGEASVIELGAMGQLGDNSWDSTEVLSDDALPWDVSADHPTLRFRPPTKPTRESGDLLPFYMACIVGERVNLVAGLLIGMGTLSGTRRFYQFADPNRTY